MKNTKKQFKRFQDMVSDKLEIFKNTDIENIEEYEHDEIFGVTIELTTMIYTTKELTEITEKMINEYIYQETGYTIDNLTDLENSFY